MDEGELWSGHVPVTVVTGVRPGSGGVGGSVGGARLSCHVAVRASAGGAGADAGGTASLTVELYDTADPLFLHTVSLGRAEFSELAQEQVSGPRDRRSLSWERQRKSLWHPAQMICLSLPVHLAVLARRFCGVSRQGD